jgi:hypothetical protein
MRGKHDDDDDDVRVSREIEKNINGSNESVIHLDYTYLDVFSNIG